MLGTSQNEILKTLLYAQDGVSIDGLAQSLKISRNATYQHVKTLERDGYVTRHEVAKTKGRPGQTYRLTRKGKDTFSHSYSMIATLLVGAVKQNLGEEKLTALLSNLGMSLAAGVGEDLSVLPLNERITRITAIMETLGYEALVEPDGSKKEAPPQIVAHNCVFHDVAEEHPEVCNMDITLLETLSGCDIDHNKCIIRGDGCCKFRFLTKTN